MTIKTRNLWKRSSNGERIGTVLNEETSADIIVIGGGFTGCSAALHCAEGGASVRLIESQEIAFGGSGRNVGLVNAGLWLEPEAISKLLGKTAGSHLNDELANSPDLVFSLIEKFGIECEVQRSGTLHCAHSTAGLRNLQNRYRQLIKHSDKIKLLSAEATFQRTGTGSYLGSLFDPRAGTIQPYHYCKGLAVAALRCGAKIHEHSPAISIEPVGGGWLVRTPKGSITAKFVVQATNAYHQSISGQKTPDYVKMSYFQVATPALPAAILHEILPGGEGCWDTALLMSSFRLDRTGRLIFGGVGSLDSMGCSAHINWANRKLAKLFPQIEFSHFDYSWTGEISMTRDHLPKIQVMGPRNFAIFGYSGRGIGPGTVFGRAVAQMILGKNIRLPVEPVNDHREYFQSPKQHCLETLAALAHSAKDRF